MQDNTNVMAGQNVTGITAASKLPVPPDDDRADDSASVATRPQVSGWWGFALTVIAGVLRLTSPVWNFTPIGALGLFGGGRLRGWQAFAWPLLVMLATDALLVPYYASMGLPSINGTTPFIYASFLINVLIGRWLCRSSSVVRLGAASLLASTQFFLLTNLGFWLTTGGMFYPQTAIGLLECFTIALPYFGSTLLGDLFYSGVFFGAYAVITRFVSQPQTRLA